MELQQRALAKVIIRMCFENQLLEAVVNNLPIINAVGEGNSTVGTKVTFLNSKDIWILGLR